MPPMSRPLRRSSSIPSRASSKASSTGSSIGRSPAGSRASFSPQDFSPNVITILATLVGLVAAAGFGVGTYSAGIIAALLFQLAAIIDCCDGEVARLTFTESPFGAWLDIAMDNVCTWRSLPALPWAPTCAWRERRCVGSSRSRFGRGPWKWALVLARHPRTKNQSREWMEDAGAGCLVGLHAQERREPRLFRHRADLCCDRQARLVPLDGRDRIRGVLALMLWVIRPSCATNHDA